MKIQKNGGLSWKSFFRLLRQLKYPWLWIVSTLVFTVFYLWLMTIVPEYTSQLVTGNFKTKYIVGTVAFNLITMTMMNASSNLKAMSKGRAMLKNREILWSRFLRLPMGFLNKRGPSNLVSCISNDLEELMGVVIEELVVEPANLYYLIATMILVRKYSWKLCLTFLATIPLMVVMAVILGKWNFKATSRINSSIGKLTQYLAIRTRSIPFIKSMSAEEMENMSGSDVIKNLFRVKYERNAVTITSNAGSTLLTVLSTIISVVAASILLAHKEITLAQWIAFFFYQSTVASTFASYYAKWPQIKSAHASGIRLAQVMQNPSEATEIYSDRNIPCGDIELKNIGFCYDDKQVLKGVSFTIRHGKTTLLMGESGSGKTTILNLLLRLYEPSAGEIRIGQTAASEWELPAYRKAFAYVTQEAGMFSGTVREAVTYGLRREVTDDEIESALKTVRASNFVHSLPEQLDAPVGELGSKLSGGERQKIAIARAILSGAPYILFDEPTAALDPASTISTLETILLLRKDHTIVIVSHELITASIADEIVHLENGDVREVHAAVRQEPLPGGAV